MYLISSYAVEHSSSWSDNLDLVYIIICIFGELLELAGKGEGGGGGGRVETSVLYKVTWRIYR